MAGWLRNVLVGLVLLALVLGGAFYWFVADGNPPGNLPRFDLDMDEVRALADQLEGDKPSDVQVETVATFQFPATAVVAGDGFNAMTLGAFSYQLVFPTQTIVVDTAFDAVLDKSLPATPDPQAYARMEAAMGSATMILVTHEHPDHIGGIIAYPIPQAIAPALRLTNEQIAHAGDFQTVPPQLFPAIEPLSYDKYLAIAPGVVLIKAPGHSPGAQMVYVQRDDGQEILLSGDVGWTLRNIETGKGRPRALSEFLLKEDRNAVFSQLDALRELHAAEPELAIVAGHDLDEVKALEAQGVLTQGFLD